MNIHEATKEKIEMAQFYAEDGAFLSAARCLREAADMFERHHRAVNEALERLSKEG